MNPDLLREANATASLYKAQAARAAAYIDYASGALPESTYALAVELADAVECLAKAVLGLQDAPPPDLRLIYGDER